MICTFHTQEHHLCHVLRQARVVAGEAEYEVAGLADVDVVAGDVVQEQQRPARGQGVKVSLAKMNAVVFPARFLHQHSNQGHHLVKGSCSRCCHITTSNGKSDYVILGLVIIRHFEFWICGGITTDF